jgi:hypothetical protein
LHFSRRRLPFRQREPLSSSERRRNLMWHFPLMMEFTPLYLAQAAVTIWMLVDANRRGVEFYWFWIILAFQPIGPWAYFFIYKARELQQGHGWLSGLFQRRASLKELQHRVERSPTPANRLELGERLVEQGEYATAMPHLEAMLAREPDHCQALFLIAASHRGLGHPEQAVAPLRKLLVRQPGWGNYRAMRTLVEVQQEVGDMSGAVASCRDLARAAPTLENRYLLAEHLLTAGANDEARKVLEQGLEDYQYLTGPSRRRDRRWVGKVRQRLKQLV